MPVLGEPPSTGNSNKGKRRWLGRMTTVRKLFLFFSQIIEIELSYNTSLFHFFIMIFTFLKKKKTLHCIDLNISVDIRKYRGTKATMMGLSCRALDRIG